MKRKLQTIIAIATIFTGVFGLVGAPSVYAQNTQTNAKNSCGGVDTAIIKCNTPEDDKQGGAILEILKIVIRIMAVGVGIVAVGGIGYGAILYASAQDNTGQVQQAKAIIRNVVIGLIAFSLMTVFLNFIIPGGVIG